MTKTRIFSMLTLVCLLVTLMFSFFSTPINAHAVFDDDFNVEWNGGNATITGSTNDMDGSFEKIIDKYKTVITFLSAIGAVSMVAFFIILFMKLGATVGNPTERSKVITGLIVTGLAAAGLGSVSLIVGIFYGMLGE